MLNNSGKQAHVAGDCGLFRRWHRVDVGAGAGNGFGVCFGANEFEVIAIKRIAPSLDIGASGPMRVDPELRLWRHNPLPIMAVRVRQGPVWICSVVIGFLLLVWARGPSCFGG